MSLNIKVKISSDITTAEADATMPIDSIGPGTPGEAIGRIVAQAVDNAVHVDGASSPAPSSPWDPSNGPSRSTSPDPYWRIRRVDTYIPDYGSEQVDPRHQVSILGRSLLILRIEVRDGVRSSFKLANHRLASPMEVLRHLNSRPENWEVFFHYDRLRCNRTLDEVMLRPRCHDCAALNVTDKSIVGGTRRRHFGSAVRSGWSKVTLSG